MKAWLNGFDGPVIALATETAATSLSAALERVPPGLALVVGPEAGFAATEIDALRVAGAVFASLGSHLLRTETAALVGAAIILNRFGSLG